MAEKMKPSGIDWIGDIPNNWETSRIKYHYQISLGKMLQPIQENSTDTLEHYMCSANITWAGVDTSILKQMWFSPAEKKQYRLLDGDLLVSEGGDVAVSCIWRNELDECYLQNAVHRVRQNALSDNRFIYYWLFFLKNYGIVDLICNKATIAHFTKEKFGELPICIMSIDEQVAIADFLDKECAQIDSIAADLEKQIALLQQYKKSLITETVTKGLDKSVPMKDSGVEWIGEIPEHWNVLRVKDISKLQTGTTPPGNEGVNFDNDGIQWFTPADFNDGSIKLGLAEKSIDFDTIHRENIKAYPANTVLFVGIASIGKIGFSPNTCYSNQQITGIKPNNNKNGKYIAYSLLAGMDSIKDNALYTTVPIVNNAYLGNIKISFPPTNEQETITKYLDYATSSVDEIIGKKLEQLSTIQQHKKSLIYEYVTGKKRVKEVQ